MTSTRWIALAVLLCASTAAAQPADPRKAEAIAHFDKGNELRERGAWAEALAEYLRARELYPTPNETTNAAICLRQLGRDDEALDLLEALLRDFPNLPAGKRSEVEDVIAALRAIVGSLVIEGGEPGATIEIDGRARGTLPASGPLHVKARSHVVRVVEEGFSPFEAHVQIAGAETVHLVIKLQPLPVPAPSAPIATPRKPLPFSIEIDGALLVVPSFGGDVVGGCSQGCTHGRGLGGYGVLRGGYALLAHLTVGLAAGFLGAEQTFTGRSTSLTPVGLAPSAGTANDTLELRGVLTGAWLGAHFGERYFLDLRLGAGAVLGWMGDVRTGTFHSSTGTGYSIGPVGSAAFASFFHLAPDLRIGARVAERVDLTAGVEGILLLGSSRPAWGPARPFDARVDGTATFKSESLSGHMVFLLAPDLGVRYRF